MQTPTHVMKTYQSVTEYLLPITIMYYEPQCVTASFTHTQIFYSKIKYQMLRIH